MVKLFLDTDCDFTLEHVKKWGVKLISMPYALMGKEFKPYEDFKELDFHAYYDTLRKGNIPTTSALNPEDYISYFEPEFKEGNDILYVHFSSAMSASFNSMRLALEELKEKYPERKLYEIDTKGITILAYLIASEAVQMFLDGKTVEEIVEWSKEEVDHFACYFFADQLNFFAKSGRVSGIAAFMGGLIGVRPILTMGSDGKMTSNGKVKGRINAIHKLADYVCELGLDLDKHDIVIGHTDVPSFVEELIAELQKRLGDKINIIVVPVNPTAGAHCGPDAMGVAFHAKHR